MKLLLSSVFAILISGAALAQSAYKIDFKWKEAKDTTYNLAYYYGEGTFIKDTARFEKGLISFQGKKKLPQGVYMLVQGKVPLFQFVIGNEKQQFQLETSASDYIKNMKVTGDEDNTIFYENMRFISDRHLEADGFIKTIQDSTLKEDEKKDAREAFKKINQKVVAYQEDLISKYPTTLTVRILKSTKEVVVPEPPKRADGSIDSSFQLRYYRKHFFDNFDLADDALIRLPKTYYLNKLNDYLDKLFSQTPDSLMNAIDGIAKVAKKNQETYKYLVWSCIYKYQKPAIMGLDEVYVRLVDKYYLSGEMDFWVTTSLKNSLKEYADKLRGSLIGKTGADLIMLDQNFQRKSLYEIKKKYTVLYIFDPDCGHCRTETPKLVTFYNMDKEKLNLEVFAVSADTSMQKMRAYIKEMKMNWITVNGPRSYVGQFGKLYYAEQTPSLYILDDKHKIVAKMLPVEKIEEFILGYERFMRKKTPMKPKQTKLSGQ